MISEFLLKGIDNLFQDKLAVSRAQGKTVFSGDTIKRDLSSVIRTKDVKNPSSNHTHLQKSNLQKNLHNIQQQFQAGQTQSTPQEMTKSRLKAYLENDRQNKLRSVIRKGDGRSKTPPKTISTINYNNLPIPFEPKNKEATPTYKYQQHRNYSPSPIQQPNVEMDQPLLPWQLRQHKRSSNPVQQFSVHGISQQQPRRISPSPNRIARASPHYRMF